MGKTEPKFNRIFFHDRSLLQYFLTLPLSPTQKDPRCPEQGFSCQYSSFLDKSRPLGRGSSILINQNRDKKTAFRAADRQKKVFYKSRLLNLFLVIIILIEQVYIIAKKKSTRLVRLCDASFDACFRISQSSTTGSTEG